MFNGSTRYIFANRYGLYKDAAGRGRAVSKLKEGIRVCAVKMCHDSDDEEGFHMTS
jgi:hypothetical protein